MSKIKRPEKIQTSMNGVNGTASNTSSPSLSAKRPPSASLPPVSAGGSLNGMNSAGPRVLNRPRRDAPTQLLGRGQRTTSAGLRSASIVADAPSTQVSEPRPYVQSDGYILRKYRGAPASLIVHLHANHFRFDQQDSTFTYKSPMKIFIEHLRSGTVPHDLLEYFAKWNITFYEGCLIVEVHDHKSIATTRDSSQVTKSSEKTEPFSIHKWNDHLTPSSWVPYPKEDPLSSNKSGASGGDTTAKQKSAMEKDKENMPAPDQLVDGHRGKSGHPAKKAKISTVVLHPTPLALHIDLAIMACTPAPVAVGARRESRVDIRAATPMSASGPRPQTPLLAIPVTPHIGMEPPAKRVKRERMEIDGKTAHAAEAQVTLATTASLFLDSVETREESARLLDALTHPEHSSMIPSPKLRKKTVAEMAAEESAAADEEQYMLILDERLSSTNGVSGAANPVDGDGQAGSASWEPRFERFKAIESIKLQNIENKKKEKMQQAEAAKRAQQEGEAREKVRQDGIKRQQEDEARQRLHLLQQQQQQQQQQIRQQQQDAQRRQMAQQIHQNQPGIQGPHPQMPQAGVQHSHPAQNNVPQRLIQQQQQMSQAQASSPTVRIATPHNLSSPMAANNLGIQMQHSNSGIGGSPPRAGSVGQQGHQQMTPAIAHAMRAQGSQQSQGGTPRLPNATPNMAQPRQVNQTPRMSQPSPLPGHMAQTPHMNAQQQMMMQQSNMSSIQHQQAQTIAAVQAQQAQQRMRNQAVQQAMGSSPPNGQPMTPQQQYAMQQMQQQHQQQGGNLGMMSAGQMSAQYAAQARQMQQAQAMQSMQQNGNANFMATNGMHPQMVQAQQAQQQQQQNQMNLQNNMRMVFQRFYQQGLPALAAQWNSQIPPEILQQYKQNCSARAQQYVANQLRAGNMRQVQQAAAAGMQQNMQMNGMGVQHRPPGM